VGSGSGVSRGDRNRNARLARLRVLVPVTNAIVGIDLADSKQMVVVTDHDSKVLVRKTLRCRAWDLGTALDWAGKQARSSGFANVTVVCELTGHRWRVLGQLAAERGMPFVCVQSLLMSWARRSEDLSFDKTDEKDAVIIARLAAQLRCYVPEPVDQTWGRLRHLGACREQLLVAAGRQVQQVRALPGVRVAGGVGHRRQPFRSSTWTAAMTVVLGRDGGDLARTRRLGLARLECAVQREITRRGRPRVCLRIVRLLFAALTDHAGVTAHRRGALERVSLLLGDWLDTHRRLDDTEQRMTSVLTPAPADRTGHLDHRPVRGRCGGDPGRDRRSAPLRHRPGVGQARRPGPTGEAVGHLRRPHQTDRTRPAQPAAGSLAGRVGRETREPGLRHPVHPPEHQRPEQAHRHPGPGRHRRGDPAAAARRAHHRPTLGPGHRHPRRQTSRGDAYRRLRTAADASNRVGVSPTRH
jgi:hypothetical protein